LWRDTAEVNSPTDPKILIDKPTLVSNDTPTLAGHHMTTHSKPKKTDLPDLSPNQLEIMQEIWDRGETTVSEVWESLLSQRQVARNTILTLMDRLTQKGWLKRRVDSGVHYYSATTARKKTLGNMVNQLIEKAFGGSSEDMVLTLLESRGLSKQESARIQSLIEQAAKKENDK